MIPKELQQKKQWTYSHDEENLKRPMHTHYKPNGALTYQSAKARARGRRHVGFYTTRKDPYVLIDVDHTTDISTLPKSFRKLLSIAPTYMEVSPSGNGLRIIYKLPEAKDKEPLKGSSFYAKEIYGDNKRNIQLNIDKPWMTITGKRFKKSASYVVEVGLEILDRVFNFRYKDANTSERVEIQDLAPLPNFKSVIGVFIRLPLDQNPRIKRFYSQLTGNEYHHYDFWLKMLMALHDYAVKADKLLECLDIAIRWSESDEDSFKSEEDVITTWKSFSINDHGISYRTMFKLSRMLLIKWPKPKKQTKAQFEAGVPPSPYSQSVQNFSTLLEYYNIKIVLDEWDKNIFYLQGDSDIIEKYFVNDQVSWVFGEYLGPYNSKLFAAVASIFLEDHDFDGVTLGKIKDFTMSVTSTQATTVNFFSLYLESNFNDLPEEAQENKEYYEVSTFDYLWSCITVGTENPDEAALFKSFYRKWLMTLVRNLTMPESEYNMNIGVLLLTGKEQIRKTTHFACLLPKMFRDKIIFTTHGFSLAGDMRDVTKLSSANFIVVWDEFEQFLFQDTESNFKKVMDANRQSFIDKYEVAASTFKPIAIYGATSNQEKFNLSGVTSRRLLHIPVTWVDTDKLLTVCWHPILNGLKKDIEESATKSPWLLTENELELQAQLLAQQTSKTDIELELCDIYDFDAVFSGRTSLTLAQCVQSGRLRKLKYISQLIAERYGRLIKPSALRRALTRQCTNYTHSARVDQPMRFPHGKVLMIHQGAISYCGQKLYVMPPIRTEEEVFK